jgi:enoyl-CoA hydratase
MTVTTTIQDDIAQVTMSNPPVNAITVADTWAIRDAFRDLGANPTVRAIILAADGRGFNAGIDIKEMQSVVGWEHLTGSGDACYAAFNTIYETPVPVIAAVNDFCMGLGIGLIASCDIIVATKGAKFGLPEVDNGALGCASHLAKLVAPMKLREMSLTCRPALAEELHAWGSIAYLTERDALLDKAREIARSITRKRPAVVSMAKAALNHLDVFDMHKNYKLEQGYTYHLNVLGDGDAARNAFVAGTREVTR